jgi:hypothetical protein
MNQASQASRKQIAATLQSVGLDIRARKREAQRTRLYDAIHAAQRDYEIAKRAAAEAGYRLSRARTALENFEENV